VDKCESDTGSPEQGYDACTRGEISVGFNIQNTATYHCGSHGKRFRWGKLVMSETFHYEVLNGSKSFDIQELDLILTGLDDSDQQIARNIST
jgi:hypothetical protein